MTVAIFSKMANLRKWGIGQESINGLAKPEMRWVTKREILTKGKFQQKWRGGAKFIKDLAKYSNEMTKKGMLIAGDQDHHKFCEDGEFGEKVFTKR